MTLVLNAGDTLQGFAVAGSAITITVSGVEIVTGGETYKRFYQGQLTTSAATPFYTTPASTVAIVKTILMVNTSGSSTTATVYQAGSAATNVIGTLQIPAGGEATWGAEGWRVLDALGQIMTSYNMTPATTTAAGSMSAADKASLVNRAKGFVNVLDYGADPTGAVSSETAITNAANSFAGAGGIVWFPPGVYLTTTAGYTLAQNNLTVLGSGANCTTLKTNATTGDQIVISGYGSCIEGFTIQGPGTTTTSNKTAGTGLVFSATEGRVSGCDFSYQYDALSLAGSLTDADNLVIRYFNHTAVVVNHASDHRISRITTDNAAATLPTGSGIDIQVAASCIIDNVNIIHSNFALNLSPATGVTVPSVKVTNSFFDTSAIGLRVAGAGSVFRSEFVNCWFSSMSTAGIYIGPTTAGNMVDGLSFVNCDIYNNVAGTTTGINLATANYGKIDFLRCNVAGWTTGIATTAGSTAWPTFANCRVGPISAFAANSTGINVGAGSYAGLYILDNDFTGNTPTVFTLGVVSPSVGAYYRIERNAGINPRGAITTPAVPASTTVLTNSTGFRAQVIMKNGSTAPTAVSINGVAVTGFLTTTVTTGINTFIIDPGGTIAVTYTVAPTWIWVGT